jgi:hypothetical protein
VPLLRAARGAAAAAPAKGSLRGSFSRAHGAELDRRRQLTGYFWQQYFSVLAEKYCS